MFWIRSSNFFLFAKLDFYFFLGVSWFSKSNCNVRVDLLEKVLEVQFHISYQICAIGCCDAAPLVCTDVIKVITITLTEWCDFKARSPFFGCHTFHTHITILKNTLYVLLSRKKNVFWPHQMLFVQLTLKSSQVSGLHGSSLTSMDRCSNISSSPRLLFYHHHHHEHHLHPPPHDHQDRERRPLRQLSRLSPARSRRTQHSQARPTLVMRFNKRPWTPRGLECRFVFAAN